MSEEYDEVADALGLPGEDDEEQESGQESAEDAQDSTDSGDEIAAGGDENPEEGSDTGESDPEAQEAVEEKSDSEISQLMGKLESLERSNSGLYRELKEERDRRKQLMEEIKKRADEQEAAKKQADAESAIPDKDEDPAGYLQAQVDRRMSEITERFDKMEQSREEQAKADAYRQAEAYVGQEEARFAQEHQDYYDALNFARQERARLLRATHPDQTEEWISGMIQQGDRMFAMQSLQQGVSPAQRAYDYAVRLGYKPGNQSGNGGQAAPAAAPAPAQASQAPASKPASRPKQTSLSAAAGRSGGRGRKLTMEEAVDLPDQDFDAVFGDPVKSRELSEQGFTFV